MDISCGRNYVFFDVIFSSTSYYRVKSVYLTINIAPSVFFFE